MAKKLYKIPKHSTGRVITTKTHFGSTSNMVVDHTQYMVAGNQINISDNEIICKDDQGFYKTFKNRIDSGLADPNRYANTNSRILDVTQLEAVTSDAELPPVDTI